MTVFQKFKFLRLIGIVTIFLLYYSFQLPLLLLLLLFVPQQREQKKVHQQRHYTSANYLCLWEGTFSVTVHQGDLQPLNQLFQLCKKESDSNSSNSQREELMGKSSGYLFHTIMDTLVDDLLHRLMKIVGNFQDIEDTVFDDKGGIVKEISLLRREITTLRRIVFPLKRTVSEITNRDIQKFSEEDLTKYFNDVEDHINKVLEVLESSKETIEIYKDTDFMLSTEKTNQILAILTIIFTLSIPATVIGTFYGMNVNIPGGIATGQGTFLVHILHLL